MARKRFCSAVVAALDAVATRVLSFSELCATLSFTAATSAAVLAIIARRAACSCSFAFVSLEVLSIAASSLRSAATIAAVAAFTTDLGAPDAVTFAAFTVARKRFCSAAVAAASANAMRRWRSSELFNTFSFIAATSAVAFAITARSDAFNFSPAFTWVATVANAAFSLRAAAVAAAAATCTVAAAFTEVAAAALTVLGAVAGFATVAAFFAARVASLAAVAIFQLDPRI